MGSDNRGSTSQPPGTPFPWPFTHSPGHGGAPSAPAQSSSSSVPAQPARPEDQHDDPTTVPAQKGVQAGAPQIPRAFCGEILTVLSNLPEEWPLIKIDLILNKAETYHVS